MGDSGQRVVVGERDEIVDQGRDVIVGRRDEGSAARVVGAATNPVLLLTELPAVLLQPRSCEEPPVDLQEEFRGDLARLADLLDGVGHGVDVAEHLDCSDVRGIITKLSGGFSPQQSASLDLQPLYPGGGDRTYGYFTTVNKAGAYLWL
ncbi:MAG TPA: hypothetical protein VNC61_00095 [Acidimicrobiales bacterium]|nr:hypothetical protein [Acidimicrobiales bacterium]